ncbi:hypothetical protein BD626DRAFT_37187 [Schizophyllum amplum]|uniref:Uncharacterized protein n=1 Tax=Schizophyllum amplum TaxID=97359 RepID=A0A550CEY7_9AGAR|nr:hypothetical protein BD626DRAFT_140083 [Auriculariopsis ampla]TRM63352.1 hypothetical protein BD626DRAFT_37187 [Auriculariopsis ampla]
MAAWAASSSTRRSFSASSSSRTRCSSSRARSSSSSRSRCSRSSRSRCSAQGVQIRRVQLQGAPPLLAELAPPLPAHVCPRPPCAPLPPSARAAHPLALDAPHPLVLELRHPLAGDLPLAHATKSLGRGGGAAVAAAPAPSPTSADSAARWLPPNHPRRASTLAVGVSSPQCSRNRASVGAWLGRICPIVSGRWVCRACCRPQAVYWARWPAAGYVRRARGRLRAGSEATRGGRLRGRFRAWMPGSRGSSGLRWRSLGSAPASSARLPVWRRSYWLWRSGEW